MFLLLKNSSQAAQPVVPFVPTGSFIGYGMEESFNSLVSPEIYLPVGRMDFSDTFEYRFVENLRRDLSKDKYTKGPLSYTGSLDMVLTSSGLGGVLCSLLGCEIPEASGTTYVFQPAYLNGPSLSFAVNTDTSEGTGLVVRRSGAIVNSLAVSSTFGEPVTSKIELIGSSSVLGSVVDFSPSWYDVEGFNFTDVSVLIDDVQVMDIKSLECVVSNGIEPINVVRLNTAPRYQTRRTFDVTLSLEIGLENSDYWTYLKESEEVKVSIDIDNGDESFTIDMVRMLVASSNLPVESSTNDNTQSLEMVSLGGSFVPVSFTLEARYF